MKNVLAVVRRVKAQCFAKQVTINPAIQARYKRLTLGGVEGVVNSIYRIAFDTTTPRSLPAGTSLEALKDRLEKAIDHGSAGLFMHTQRSGLMEVTDEDRWRFVKSVQDEFSTLCNFLLANNDIKLTNRLLRYIITVYSEKKHDNVGIMKGDLMLGWNMTHLARLIAMHSFEKSVVESESNVIRMHDAHDIRMFRALSEVLMHEWLQLGLVLDALYVSHAINVPISHEDMEYALDMACARCSFSQIRWGLQALGREWISRQQAQAMVQCYFTRWVPRARLNYVFEFPNESFMKHMKVSDIKRIMEVAKSRDAEMNRDGHLERQFQAILDSKRATVIPICSALVA